MSNAKIQAAIDAITGPVSNEFSEARRNHDEAEIRQRKAYEDLERQKRGQSKIIRQFIAGYLKLKDGQSLHFEKPTWAVNYDRRRTGSETTYPYITVTVTSLLLPHCRFDASATITGSGLTVEKLTDGLDRLQSILDCQGTV